MPHLMGSVVRAQDLRAKSHSQPQEQIVRLDAASQSHANMPAWAMKSVRCTPASGLLDVPEEQREQQLLESRVRGTRWIWSSIGAVVACLLLALSGLHWRASKQDRGYVDFLPKYEAVEENLNAHSPVYFFDHDREATLRNARQCWNLYADATEWQQVVPLVARAEEMKPLLRRHWQPGLVARMPSLDPQLFAVSRQTDGRGFFQIQGYDERGRSYCAYFVEEEGVMKLDWEATTGFCPIAFADMENAALVEPALLRVNVARANYYSPAFPEDRYAAYCLTDSLDQEVLWGYVLRDSLVQQALDRVLGGADSLVAEESVARVTLKLQRPTGHKIKNQFLITEMLHNDWVMP